ncbi:MAG TPA: RDD family protein [Pelobium sp.]
MDKKLYYLVIAGKPAGPFTIDQLKSQPIKPDSFLKTDEMDDYKEAHEIAEVRATLGFSEEFTAPQYKAGFDLRLLATAIDWLIVFGIFAFFELILALSLADQSATQQNILSGLLLLPFLKLFYNIYMENYQQATIGKKLLSIKVTDTRGLTPSLRQHISRNFAKILSTLPFFAGYFYLFLNKEQQTLHDKLAETLVVKDRLI